MNQRDLIEEAMRGVRVVVCGRCRGLGQIGAPTLRITCVDCRGCGETTVRATTQLEAHYEAQS